MIILTCKQERKSAQKLGLPVYLYELPHDLKDSIVLRWGWGGGPKYKNEINPQKAICLNCNKYQARMKLGEVVRIPKTYGPGEEFPAGKYVERPFWHSKGKNFKIVQGPDNVSYETYVSEFLEAASEYRVWFCGEHVKAAKRAPLEGQTGDCRSNFGYLWRACQPKLKEYVLKAAAAIGLKTGAADVLLVDGKWYFLELNSAPCLDHWRVLEFYTSHLEELNAS